MNRSAIYDPSRRIITHIASDDALILLYRANPARWNFREPQVSMATETQRTSSGTWTYIGIAALIVIVIAAVWFYAQ